MFLQYFYYSYIHLDFNYFHNYTTFLILRQSDGVFKKKEGESVVDNIEFLTQEEKDALSFNDLATYMELLNMLKTQIESIEK